MNRDLDIFHRLDTARKIKNGLLVEIGSTATNISVITDSRILSTRAVGIGDDTFDEDIVEYMAMMHCMRIDIAVAKQIKAAVGSALSELTDEPEAYTVVGPNKITGHPMHIPVSYQEISYCLHNSIHRIERTMMTTIDNLPCPVQAAILEHGVCLSGVGSSIRGLSERIQQSVVLPAFVKPINESKRIS